MQPETHYAQSGDVNIAYQVVGNGPLDLVIVPGAFSHLEVFQELTEWRAFIERLATFARVILFDKRGTGMSDRVPIATLEERMDDVRAVMDAAHSEQATILGVSEGGPMSVLFAATYPERTRALILYGTYANEEQATEDELKNYAERARANWGTEAESRRFLKRFAPSAAEDMRVIGWNARLTRFGGSPGAAIALARMNQELDVREILPSINVPTLILHRQEDEVTPIQEAHYLHQHIPNAKLVALPGQDHYPFFGDMNGLIDEIEEFLTGVRDPLERNRVLATIMFTDIVESTQHALERGDRKWRELLEQHHSIVRKNLARFRGKEIDTAGDGFFATFDGPARAIRCAQAITNDVKKLGVEVRASLHTGECEIIGDKVGGIAVHIGARVLSKAGASQVIVSSTVKDLVAGSGIQFQDYGTHALKGIPGEWRLYQVVK